MIFSRGSLILGGLVMAVGAETSGNETVGTFFASNWNPPDTNISFPTTIYLGTLTTFQFSIPSTTSRNIQLVLCQTNASPSTQVDGTNSWSVEPFQSKHGYSSIPKGKCVNVRYSLFRSGILRRFNRNWDITQYLLYIRTIQYIDYGTRSIPEFLFLLWHWNVVWGI
jgi:hypothetical protein